MVTVLSTGLALTATVATIYGMVGAWAAWLGLSGGKEREREGRRGAPAEAPPVRQAAAVADQCRLPRAPPPRAPPQNLYPYPRSHGYFVGAMLAMCLGGAALVLGISWWVRRRGLVFIPQAL